MVNVCELPVSLLVNLDASRIPISLFSSVAVFISDSVPSLGEDCTVRGLILRMAWILFTIS